MAILKELYLILSGHTGREEQWRLCGCPDCNRKLRNKRCNNGLEEQREAVT